MVNTLGVYNPIFYANEALIHLYKAMGMARRVHLGFDQERKSFRLGDTISIRRPSTFTAQNAPSTAQDLDTETVSLQLNNWKEVKFQLTDQELAYTGERIINDHIVPAAYALADDIDQNLSGLADDVPWFADLNDAPGSVTTSDITGVRRAMFDNAVPLADPSMIHYMVDGKYEQGFLDLQAFTQQQGAGDAGVSAQMRGQLGMKFGANIFANQNTQEHTAGTLAGTPLLQGAGTKGDESITLDAGSLTGTLLKGDTFVIAGNTQRYAVTADATAAGNAITVSISPPLQAAYADNAAVTVELDDHTQNLMFHRNFAALAVAPLPMTGNGLGARIATVTDPFTGISLRSRIFYEGDDSRVKVALDILYGFKTLDPNLAVRGRGNV